MNAFESWLVRKPAGPKPRKALKRTGRPKKVSKKRAGANREYTVRRKAFLLAHPYCEAMGTISWFILDNGTALEWQETPAVLQLSTEIHHTKKPKCKYLNDESTWLAVCRWAHEWIEDHKDIARNLRLLHY